MMVSIGMKEFLPDHPHYRNPSDIIARNVIPTPGGYGPMRELTPYTEALPGDVRGAYSVKMDDGVTYTFAGTATKLYRLNSSLGWDDVTRTTGGDYAVPTGGFWQFAKFGTIIAAVNGNDAVQKFDVSGGSRFEALGGNPPVAKYVAVVRDFLVLGNLPAIGGQASVAWSGINDAETWQQGSKLSDIQPLPEGGEVCGMTGGQYGVICQQRRISQMTFTPGPLVFTFDTIEEDRGCAAPGSIIRVGGITYFIAQDGLYAFAGGGGATNIGAEKFSEWFVGDIDGKNLDKILSVADDDDTIVMFAYVSTSSSDQTRDRVLIFNWVTGEASYAEFRVDAFLQAYTQGFTLEQLDGFGTVDTIVESFDSPVWKAGLARRAAFDSQNRLGFFEGDILPATVTVGEQGDGSTVWLVTEVRPLVDNQNVAVRIGSRNRLGDIIQWTDYCTLNARGVCVGRRTGRYITTEINTAGTWSRMQGVEANVEDTGNR